MMPIENRIYPFDAQCSASDFIFTGSPLCFHDFDGLIWRAEFSVNKYCDDFFTELNIDLPATLFTAVNKRKAEYLAGRWLARDMLAGLGYPGCVPGRDEHTRAPLWPAGVIGSLSHSGHAVVCALHAGNRYQGVGVDIESRLSLQRATELKSYIISADEESLLHRHGFSLDLGLTLVFSAKESLFKAAFPMVKQYFDFLEARVVALDAVKGCFSLALLRDLGHGFYRGRCFDGYFINEVNAVNTVLYF